MRFKFDFDVEKLEDLEEFRGMKKPSSVLEYPIVVRKHLNYITVSLPDLGLFETLELPKKNLNKDYVTIFLIQTDRVI